MERNALILSTFSSYMHYNRYNLNFFEKKNAINIKSLKKFDQS